MRRTNVKFFKSLTPYVYCSPFFLMMAGFMILPFILNIVLSFTNYSMTKTTMEFIGLKNYETVLLNDNTWDSVRLTIIFVIGIVIFTMLIGVLYAFVMSFNIKGINFLKAIILLPWIIPESVTAYIWKWIFSADSGIIYFWLLNLGIIDSNTSFFADGALAMVMVIMANVWRTAPFVAIMTYAQLKTIPKNHTEAAQIDGANGLKVFLHITIPWLIPILKRCAILLFVWSFNSFTIIYILTNGGPAGATTTLPYLIRQTAFNNFNFGQATALSTLSLIIVVVCMAIASIILKVSVKMFKKGGRY